jgi:hypothetical protein
MKVPSPNGRKIVYVSDVSIVSAFAPSTMTALAVFVVFFTVSPCPARPVANGRKIESVPCGVAESTKMIAETNDAATEKFVEMTDERAKFGPKGPVGPVAP